MEFKQVTVQELLPTSPYLNIRIGADVSVSDCDDPMAAFRLAHEKIIQFHKEIYPAYYNGGVQPYFGDENLPTIQERDR